MLLSKISFFELFISLQLFTTLCANCCNTDFSVSFQCRVEVRTGA